MEARTQGLGAMHPPPVSAPPAQFEGSPPATLPEVRLIAVQLIPAAQQQILVAA